jgi:DNA-binding NtrC family response regulator
MGSVLLVVAGAHGVPPSWHAKLKGRGTELVEVRHVSAVDARLQLDGDQVLVFPVPGGTTEVLHVSAELRTAYRDLPLVLFVNDSSEASAVEALRLGVADYHRLPCSEDLVVSVVQRWTGRGRQPLRRRTVSMSLSPSIVGDSHPVRHLREYIPRVATTDASVLITGETGVGKELVAELIHLNSHRRHRPCVAINCAAIPESLLESELFGVERGAFTGAEAMREGSLKSAEGGTVLFDEIGDMGLSGQAKILRAIETREVTRLGGRSRVPINVRIIAATNQDLEQLTAAGQFRKDLYYRLNVVRIHLPPLRERKSDLEPLLDHYIRHFNARFNREVEGFTPDAMEHLRRHDWPGNIRELRNLVEAVFVNLNGRRITYVDLPETFRQGLERTRSLPTDERERLLSALFATRWNKSKAAQDLHWSRMTLYRKLAKYHVVRSDGHK